MLPRRCWPRQWCRASSRCRSSPWRPCDSSYDCTRCANCRSVIWIRKRDSPKSFRYSTLFSVPSVSTVGCPENRVSETNSRSVVNVGKGNCGKDECSGRRLIDPAVSAICCSKNCALTGVQRSANCDTVVRIGEGNSIEVSRGAACLSYPNTPAIGCSDDCTALAHSRPSICISK